MRALLLLPLVATACATTQHAQRAVEPNPAWPRDTQLRTYDVEADDARTLRAQLDARGPEDSNGDRHDAYTAWYVTWHYPLQLDEAGCVTGPVSTTVRVTVTVPRWLSRLPPKDPLVERWQRYLEALKTHESGHRETGYAAATAITESLEALPPEPTCEAMETTANEAANRLLEQYRAHDVAYDEETKHGATQGAVFP